MHVRLTITVVMRESDFISRDVDLDRHSLGTYFSR